MRAFLVDDSEDIPISDDYLGDGGDDEWAFPGSMQRHESGDEEDAT